MAEFSMSIDKLILVNGFRTSCANAEANREDWASRVLRAGGESNGMTLEAAGGEFMLKDCLIHTLIRDG